MNLLILGATGRTGKHILDEALRRGHKVNALVRDKSKVKNDPQCVVFEGNPADPESLQVAMEGCQAIISALNISRTSDFPWAKLRTPKNFLGKTISQVISLAGRKNIRRIVVISASGVGDSQNEIPGFFRWLIDHSNIGYAYREHENQEKLLEKSSLEWTALRPSGLTNLNKIQKVRVSFHGKPKPRMMISRKTVATYILDVVEKNLHVCETPTISAD